MSTPALWPHQEATIAWGQKRPFIFDTSDPGTGKTRAHIELFCQRLAAGETRVLLVVCPRSLMRAAWEADIRRFAPHLRISIATAAKREEAFAKDSDVYIINFDGVKYLAKQSPTWLENRFGLNGSLIVDESTAFKSPQAQRTKAMFKLAKLFYFTSLLTATPSPNSITELWSQTFIGDRGTRLGTSFYGFRNQVQVGIQQGMFTKWADRPEAVAAVMLLLKDVMIRHDFDSVMDVPPIYSRKLTFDLPIKLKRAYNAMAAEAYAEIGSAEVTAVNAAVQINKLLQIASGAVYDESGTANYIESDRYELIADLVEERDHSVVFFSWTHQQEGIAKLLKARGLSYVVLDGRSSDKERLEAVEQYQAGAYRAILLHPKTGAHGLTLTRGRAVIWASPRYEADFMKQGIYRIRRGVQDKTTENIMICANDTIEESVYSRQESKADAMNLILKLSQHTGVAA